MKLHTINLILCAGFSLCSTTSYATTAPLTPSLDTPLPEFSLVRHPGLELGFTGFYADPSFSNMEYAIHWLGPTPGPNNPIRTANTHTRYDWAYRIHLTHYFEAQPSQFQVRYTDFDTSNTTVRNATNPDSLEIPAVDRMDNASSHYRLNFKTVDTFAGKTLLIRPSYSLWEINAGIRYQAIHVRQRVSGQSEFDLEPAYRYTKSDFISFGPVVQSRFTYPLNKWFSVTGEVVGALQVGDVTIKDTEINEMKYMTAKPVIRRKDLDYQVSPVVETELALQARFKFANAPTRINAGYQIMSFLHSDFRSELNHQGATNLGMYGPFVSVQMVI